MIVWHEGAIISSSDDERLTLRCWTTYVVESVEEMGIPRSLRPELLPRASGEPFRYRVNFGDYIGRLTLDGVDVTVCSPKLDEEGFDALLGQITSRVAELPFDFGSPTFVPFAREALQGRDLLHHALLYLRWAAWYTTPSLGELWASVCAEPHRQLIREVRTVPLWEARTVSPRTLEGIVADSSTWCPVAGNTRLAATDLARSLNVGGTAYLPATVTEPSVRTSVDTAENRFVKHFLELASDLVDRVASLLGTQPSDSSLQRDAVSLAQELRTMAGTAWLSEVGEMQRFPSHSQVMQKRFGYREILRHYLALVLASRYPLAAADISRIVETKSASTLYEYWTFFEFAEALGGLLGRPTEAVKTTESSPFSSSLSEKIKLTFPSTSTGLPVELWYNRTFSRSGSASHSYSVSLRPDITLRVGSNLHLFDAKFRVDQFDISVDESIAEEEAEARGTVTRGWFKHADIHKMHAYKDAIGREGERVESVWVLYPGTEFAFFGEDGRKVESAAELPEAPRGVGAIPMMPGVDSALDHAEVLRRVLRSSSSYAEPMNRLHA